MLYGGHIGHNFSMIKNHRNACLILFFVKSCLFGVKIIGLSSLEVFPPF